MPQRPVQPANAILINGNPTVEEYEVETETNMYPGKLVKAGTGAHQVVVCGDGEHAIGVLDVMPDKKLTKMYSDATPYAAGDQVLVMSGSFVAKLRADHAGTIVKGAKVFPADTGNVDEGAHADEEVGTAEEATTPGATDGWVIVNCNIPA